MSAMDFVILQAIQQLGTSQGGGAEVGTPLLAPVAPSNKYLPMDGRIVHRADVPDYAALVPPSLKLSQYASPLAANVVSGNMLKASMGSTDQIIDRSVNLAWEQPSPGPGAFHWGSTQPYTISNSNITPGPTGAFGVMAAGTAIISYDNGATLFTTILPAGHTQLVWIDNPGIWVAYGGDYKSFSVSSDGVGWNHYAVNHASLTSGTLWGVSYLNGTWCVMVNANPYISTDLSTWTQLATLGTNATPNANARLITAGGMAMAFADSGSQVYPLRSYDLKVWSYCKPPSLTISIASSLFTYQNGRFILTYSSAIYSTVDGVVWTVGALAGVTSALSIGWLNGLYYGCNYGNYAVSSDLIAWTKIPWAFASVTTIGGFVGTGSGLVYFSEVGFASTQDFITWSQGATLLKNAVSLCTTGPTLTLNGSLYLHTGNGFVRTSDGLSWKALVAQFLPFATDGILTVGACGPHLGWSTDGGDTWTRSDSVATQNLNFIAYGGGVWVAVGVSGVIMRSTDGQTWSPQTSNTTNLLTKVIYANGYFVAFGGTGTLVTSPDGITWTVRTTGVTTAIVGVAWAGPLSLWTFVCVNSGTSTVIATSPDLGTWTSRQTSANAMNDIVWMNSTLMAIGANGVCYKSTNGTTWTALSGLLGSFQTNRVAWSASLGVWFLCSSGSAQYYTSPDATTWTARVLWGGFGTVYYGVAQFTSAYGDVLMWSHRGLIGVPTATLTVLAAWNWLAGITIMDLAASSSAAVLVTSAGSIWLKTSTTPWTSMATGLPAFTQVIWSGTLFIALCATGAIYTSPTGAVWTPQTSGVTSSFAGIAVDGAGGALAYTVASEVLFSADGVTWAPVSLPSGSSVSGVTYLGGYYYVLGGVSGAPLMYRSANGTVWAQITFALAGAFTYVTTLAGSFMALGLFGNQPKALVSPDNTFASYMVSPVQAVDYKKTLNVGGESTTLTGNYGTATFEVAMSTSDVALPSVSSPITGLTYYIRVQA